MYLMSGSSHDGGKHGPGSIVTGKTGFAHAGPIVDHESSNIFVAHGGELRVITPTLAVRGEKSVACSFFRREHRSLAVSKKVMLELEQ